MSGALSLRGGALVLKSISLFLAHSRGKSASPSSRKKSPPKSKSKMMQEARDAKNKITPKLLEQIKKETHFNKMEIDSLYKIHRQLVSLDRNKPHGDRPGATGGAIHKSLQHQGIHRNVFCELLHNTFNIVTEDLLTDRIFTVWDIEGAGAITQKAWFFGLSVFLRGTLIEQIDMCFSIYDINSDGFITKEEMFILLRNCLIRPPQEEDPDEGVKELVEIVLKKMDVDGDGKVSRNDFQVTVEKEPLLLHAFGPCLPTKNAAETFLETLRNQNDTNTN